MLRKPVRNDVRKVNCIKVGVWLYCEVWQDCERHTCSAYGHVDPDIKISVQVGCLLDILNVSWNETIDCRKYHRRKGTCDGGTIKKKEVDCFESRNWNME